MQKSETSTVFIEADTIEWQIVGDGIRRKVMGYDERIMLVKVEFRKGAIGAVHQHPHTQVTHVESGVFEVEIGGEKKVLKGGDVFLAPSNVPHGVVCLESGVLTDVFTPMREDFVAN
jgi:quercetin dioxygenase-like cupin family protein